ncbi:unnamed protein product [Closterium sp. NIES-54]
MTTEFLTAIKARYATPTTIFLGRLLLLFLFPDLASFERTGDLISHLLSLDSSYRTACADAQLALLPPPMAITIYIIATSLPNHLALVRDALLLKHPSELTIEVLESALKDVESNLRSVASASGVVPRPLFHGCTVPQLPTFTASLATPATNVTAAAVTNSSRSRGRSGRRGSQGAGGGDGAVGVTWRAAAAGVQALEERLVQRSVTPLLLLVEVTPGGVVPDSMTAAAAPPLATAIAAAAAVAGFGAGARTASAATRCRPPSLHLSRTPHAMYAVGDSNASECVYSSVVSLGASLAEVPVASVGTCVDTSPGAAPEDASLSFTLDFGASLCFFCDRTTLTPLPTHVSVALADPTLGPVTARYTTTLPCPAVPSSSLTGFHVPLFSRNLVGVRPLVTQHVGVWIEPSGENAVCVDADTYAPLAIFTAEPGFGLYTLHTRPRGQQQQQLLSPTPVTVPHPIPRLTRYFFLVVIDDYSRYTTVFPLAKKSNVTSTLIRWLLTTAEPHGRRISCLHSDRGGLVMEIARTSMTHACAPHFLWPYAVRYASHQLNLWPRVSRPEVSPTSLWTGSPGVASCFRVWGCLALVRDTSADKISPRAVPCMFLGFPEDSSDYTFYHPPLNRFFESCDIRFDESVPYYVRYLCRGLPVPPPPLFLNSAPPRAPPVQPPPPGPALSGVSHATPPPSVATQVQPPSLQSSSQPTADPAGAGFRSDDPGGASSRAEPLTIGDSSLWGAGVSGLVPGGATPGGAPSIGLGEPRTDPVTSGGGGSGGGATGSLESGPRPTTAPDTTPPPHPYQTRHQARVRRATAGGAAAATAAAGAGAAAAVAATAAAATSSSSLWSSDPRPPLSFSSPPFSSRLWSPASSFGPLPSCFPSSSAPVVPSSFSHLAFAPPRSSPSVLPSPPESALTASLSTRVTDYYRTYRPILYRVLASLVTDPRASLSSVSALIAAVTDFASTHCLDYATSLVDAPPTSPLAVGGESALGCDALEDRQFELELLAAASPHLCSMLLAPEGDPDALDIPTPHTYAEAVSGPWASQWRAAMDSEMASYRSTGTYVDEVPLPVANVVYGMWIFRVKRSPGSPLVFKALYVAKGFSQHEGVDFFQTFAPTLKMNTLRMLLHVAAQRDYELHSLDFSTVFLQGSLHEEVWLRRPSAFTGTFPPETEWRLRRPVYDLHQAPREWHDTLHSTLSDLGFQPYSADPSLFACRGSTPFFVVVYVDDLVFTTADRVSLAGVKLELQKRHTCTDLGDLRHYLGLQITRDRAARTITLSQSHMVQQVLQWFELQNSTVQRTPLAVDHRLTGPFLDEPFEPNGPYAELVGSLMYLMTCTRPNLAFPLSILARFVAPGRHRPVHWTTAVRVAKYLATTSGVGLVLGGRQDVVLTGHCDSSYADDAETHRSTQGYCFSLGSGAISWRSTRSSSVSASTAEAEIYAGAMAAQELRWLTFLLTNLAVCFSPLQPFTLHHRTMPPKGKSKALPEVVSPDAPLSPPAPATSIHASKDKGKASDVSKNVTLKDTPASGSGISLEENLRSLRTTFPDSGFIEDDSDKELEFESSMLSDGAHKTANFEKLLPAYVAKTRYSHLQVSLLREDDIMSIISKEVDYTRPNSMVFQLYWQHTDDPAFVRERATNPQATNVHDSRRTCDEDARDAAGADAGLPLAEQEAVRV